MNTDLPTTITKGGLGGSIEVGINLARPFTKKALISPYVGLGVMSARSYQSGFIQQLKDDFVGFPIEYSTLQMQDPSFLSNEERGLLESYELAADEFNHITNNNIKTKLSFYYGAAFKLPFKYIPLMKVYRSYHYIAGSEKTRPVGFITYNPSTTDPFSDTAGEIEIDGYGFEIDLFTGWFSSIGRHIGNARLAQVSLYVESYNLSSLKIGKEEEYSLFNFNTEKIPVTAFFGPSETFSKTYKHEIRMGIKLAISIL